MKITRVGLLLASHVAGIYARSGFLALAAITVRICLAIASLTAIDFDIYYSAIAGLCWLPNVLVALRIMPDSKGRRSAAARLLGRAFEFLPAL